MTGVIFLLFHERVEPAPGCLTLGLDGLVAGSRAKGPTQRPISTPPLEKPPSPWPSREGFRRDSTGMLIGTC